MTKSSPRFATGPECENTRQHNLAPDEPGTIQDSHKGDTKTVPPFCYTVLQEERLMYGPNLTGARVRLIAPTLDMAPTFVSWLANPQVTRYLARNEPPTLKQEEEWIEQIGRSNTDLLWSVMVGDKLIGNVGIHGIDWRARKAETGTLFGATDEWNKGYATEAQALRTRYAFDMLGLQKLTTRVYTENKASIRALEKNGYRGFGVARREAFLHGCWHDMWYAELLVEEWQAQNAGSL
jgi:RimJ/RimL family protein N-acetyltransferase